MGTCLPSLQTNLTQPSSINRESYHKYLNAPISSKDTVPGHGYFTNIQKFYADHFEKGELYQEYLKHSCGNSESCTYCRENEWVGPVIGWCPRPVPDPEQLSEFHYNECQSTPMTKEDGTPRDAEDFQPWVQLKRAFQNDEISSDDTKAIQDLSTKYILEEKHIKNYLLHLEDLKYRKQKRGEKATRQRMH